MLALPSTRDFAFFHEVHQFHQVAVIAVETPLDQYMRWLDILKMSERLCTAKILQGGDLMVEIEIPRYWVGTSLCSSYL
jgi:hypothetical protein